MYACLCACINVCYLCYRWNKWPQPSLRWICFRVIRFTAWPLGSHFSSFLVVAAFLCLKFVSKYIWHFEWRGSLAHAMRTVNTHLSSYLFVFYISWFNTTTLTLSHSRSQTFAIHIQWILLSIYLELKCNGREREKRSDTLWFAAPIRLHSTLPLLLLATHTHRNVYINTIQRNEREFTSDCHAWACCCVAKINEWKLRYTTEKNYYQLNWYLLQKKNNNMRLWHCHHQQQQVVARFHPFILSNMHMWIVHGAYELVCSVLFGHFPYSLASSCSLAYLLVFGVDVLRIFRISN